MSPVIAPATPETIIFGIFVLYYIFLWPAAITALIEFFIVKHILRKLLKHWKYLILPVLLMNLLTYPVVQMLSLATKQLYGLWIVIQLIPFITEYYFYRWCLPWMQSRGYLSSVLSPGELKKITIMAHLPTCVLTALVWFFLLR